MSTCWFFKYDKKYIYNLGRRLEIHERRPITNENRKKDNNAYCFCVGCGAGNGAWISLDKNGTGIITRYAGTSPENLSFGFGLVTNTINATEIICEYDLFNQEGD